MLLNIGSMLGPLYPALVSDRLDANAAAYGAIGAAAVLGGAVGGVLSGPIERFVGAGKLMAIGWALAGMATVGIGLSTVLPLTLALESVMVLGMTAGGVAMGAVTGVLVPENFRGRVFGLSRSLGVVLIPLSAPVGGLLADVVGVVPLFVACGLWTILLAGAAYASRHVRTVRLGEPAPDSPVESTTEQPPSPAR